MDKNKYNDFEDDISEEELDFLKILSHMQCIEDGIYPELNFVTNQDIDNFIEY